MWSNHHLAKDMSNISFPFALLALGVSRHLELAQARPNRVCRKTSWTWSATLWEHHPENQYLKRHQQTKFRAKECLHTPASSSHTNKPLCTNHQTTTKQHLHQQAVTPTNSEPGHRTSLQILLGPNHDVAKKSADVFQAFQMTLEQYEQWELNHMKSTEAVYMRMQFMSTYQQAALHPACFAIEGWHTRLHHTGLKHVVEGIQRLETKDFGMAISGPLRAVRRTSRNPVPPDMPSCSGHHTVVLSEKMTCFHIGESSQARNSRNGL